MKVLLAGATGALGSSALPQLKQAGHDIVALTRSRSTAQRLEARGVTVVLGDLLDGASVHAAVRGAEPEAVIHAAKAIPSRGPLRYADMAVTNRLHDAGTRHLVDAALAYGVRRLVVESIVFAYGYGDLGEEPITEDHAVDPALPARLEEIHRALRAMEIQALETATHGVQPVVLRFGLHYGPRASDQIVSMMRMRAGAVPRGDRGLWPVVHLEDAAAALVASLDAPSGVYNVVDDEPVSPGTLFDAMAEATGGRKPWRVPERLVGAVAPYFAQVAATRARVSNRKAAELMGWRPVFRDYRAGVRTMAQRP